MASSSSSSNGKILKRADPSTIQDKFLVGYQGWFTCPGDGDPIAPDHHGWLHWFDRPMSEGGNPCVDLWPDVSSYSPSELYPVPGLKNKSGEQVYLFSSRNSKTVQRHFNWMALHGIDGAFLQRFAAQCDLEAGNHGIMRIRDEVGDLVKEAAEKEGRVFAIMYDVSGVPADRLQRIIERDWLHLIHQRGIIDSPNYLKEKGKIVVAFWGFGFDNAGHTPALVKAITSYIRSVTPGGAYIMAGAPADWRTAQGDADRNPEFLDVWLNDFDAISPWTVGRYRTDQEADDFAETKMKGDADLLRKRADEGARKVDYIPVVLPGGSGYNLTQGKWGYNDTKRQGGRFLWKQIFNAKRHGARIMYGAMWDEYDEGTAFMPVVETKRLLPDTDRFSFMALDADGYDVPSDWYMRICGFAVEALRSERRIFESFPSKELQDYWSSRPRYEEVSQKSGEFISGSSQAGASGSGGDGQSYEQWLAAQREGDKEEPPPPPYSLEDDEPVAPAQTAQPVQPTQPTQAIQPQPPVPQSQPTAHSQYSIHTQYSGPAPNTVPSTPVSPGSSAHFMSDTGASLQASPLSMNVGLPPTQASSPHPTGHSQTLPSGPGYGPGGPNANVGSPGPSAVGPHDAVSALANDFGRQSSISGSYPTSTQPLHPHHSSTVNYSHVGSGHASPPPLHPTHPAANSGYHPVGPGPTSPPPLHPAHPAASSGGYAPIGPGPTSPPPLHHAHSTASSGYPPFGPTPHGGRPPPRPHTSTGYAGPLPEKVGYPGPESTPPSQYSGYPPGPSGSVGPPHGHGGHPAGRPPNGPGPTPSSQWSQDQWPPADWKVNPSTQPQSAPPHQQGYPSTHAGPTQPGGANLSRPQTFSASSLHSVGPSPLRPHASLAASSVRPPQKPPSVDGSPTGFSHNNPGGPSSGYPTGPSSYKPNEPSGSYSPAGPLYSHHHGPGHPHGHGGIGFPQASPFAPATSSFPGSPVQGSSAHSPPSSSYPSPGGSSYAGDNLSSYYASAPGNAPTFPGGPYSAASPGSGPTSPPPPPSQTSYGPPGQPHAPHAPHGGPSHGGALHFPQAAGPGGPGGVGSGSGYYNPNPQYANYPAQGPSYPYGPGPNPTAFPGAGGGIPLPHQQPSGGASFPMPMGGGAMNFALNAVDKYAGKKTRLQLENQIGSLAQSGSNLFNKFTK
ncbi:hypothetical protein BDN72DRAFT_837263 [Pluteus cervinus]|uniref:Uncharacterized protein n=1 Tax=Pluteus cervinus TaxID=181527 RepID=A0ACD3B1E4_9AGAR|nr:hypothetical protein BDN72DRAFT_837263 [Pluteus cervinus]